MKENGEEEQGDRRVVTILFLDVCGYTALSATLDPEDIRELMNRFFKLCIEQIYKYQGVIDKLIGDSVMALFGAPKAHETDPECAVRAAMEILEALEEFNRNQDAALHVRIGIHTGLVFFGKVGPGLAGSYTVVGNTVNMASRLEQAASQDQILISEETYRLVERIFRCQKKGPLILKGLEGEVLAYAVMGERQGLIRRRGLFATQAVPLVGRKNEITKIQEIITQVLQGQGQVLSVTGEAGIGKSGYWKKFAGII